MNVAYPTVEEIRELPVTHRATIPETYLDAMGHMNVMWYTFLFSQAVAGVFQMIGLTKDYMTTHCAGTFALEKHLRYLSEVRVGQDVAIHTRVIARSDKRFHFLNLMINESNQRLAAISETVNTHVDLTIRRSSAMPESVGLSLDELIEQHSQLEWTPPLCGVMKA